MPHIALVAYDKAIEIKEFEDEGDLLAQVSDYPRPTVILPILNLLPDQVLVLREIVQQHTYSDEVRFIDLLVMIIEAEP